MGFDPGVFGRFDLAALVQPHLNILVCWFVSGTHSYTVHTTWGSAYSSASHRALKATHACADLPALLLHFMVYHSKWCHNPRTSG